MAKNVVKEYGWKSGLTNMLEGGMFEQNAEVKCLKRMLELNA